MHIVSVFENDDYPFFQCILGVLKATISLQQNMDHVEL